MLQGVLPSDGLTLTFTIPTEVGSYSSKIWYIVNYDCRNTWSISYIGAFIIKYHSNSINVGNVSVVNMYDGGAVPKASIVDKKIVFTYTSDHAFTGSLTVACIGS